jgi:hypothetical protein
LKFNNGYIVLIYDKEGNKLADAIEHFGSYGEGQDLLEIMHAIADGETDDSVLGWLTWQDVLERFRYCLKHQTSIYEKEAK